MSKIGSASVNKRSPEVVYYADPRKRVKNEKIVPTSKRKEDPQESKESEIISMKRARFDVHKFGIKGFHKDQRDEAEIQLAISLGAKPLKNKYYNYKEFTAMRQEKKRLALEKRELERGKTNKLDSKKDKGKKKFKRKTKK